MSFIRQVPNQTTLRQGFITRKKRAEGHFLTVPLNAQCFAKLTN